MKKIVSLLLVLCMMLGMSTALAETWFCPNCGTENTSNFCGECGTKKSDEWTCPNCNTVNKSKFCGECGTARGTAPAQPTAAPESAIAGFTAVPRVEFYHKENRAKVFFTSTDVLYAGDYAVNTNYFVAVNVTNNNDTEKTLTLSARVNDQTFSFNPYTFDAGESHGFYITSVELVPGTYEVEWLVGEEVLGTMNLTIKNGQSDFYRWMTANAETSVGMCVWDKSASKRVRNGVEQGYTSQLDDNQIYCPHLIIKNNDDEPTPTMFVSFLLDGSTWWWSSEVLEANQTMNYVHSSYEHKEGQSEVVMFINGIEVGTGYLNIVIDD